MLSWNLWHLIPLKPTITITEQTIFLFQKLGNSVFCLFYTKNHNRTCINVSGFDHPTWFPAAPGKSNITIHESWKNLLSCKQLQIAVHTAIAWRFPAGNKPSFKILQLFQKETKARSPKKTQQKKNDYKMLPRTLFCFYSSSHHRFTSESCM